MVSALVSPESVGIFNNFGKLPIHAASEAGFSKGVQHLLQNAGVDVNIRTKSRSQCLCYRQSYYTIIIFDCLPDNLVFVIFPFFTDLLPFTSLNFFFFFAIIPWF